MFNKKTRFLQRQLDEALGKISRLEENSRYLHQIHDDEIRNIRSLIEERNELIKSNGQLKRDLETEIRQKEELAALLTDAQKKIESSRNTIETQQSEILLLYEDGYSPVERIQCPTDCVTHANPGNGASRCRNCIRNPHAVDKYKKGEL